MASRMSLPSDLDPDLPAGDRANSATPGDRAGEAGGITRAIDDVPLLDRLVARWEVSRLSTVPLVINNSCWLAAIMVLIIFATATGTKVAARIIVLCWIVSLGLELGRAAWTARHRYVSSRWIRAACAAVGEEVMTRALAELIKRRQYEPEYVVTRSDLIGAVREQRAKDRDAARRAEGFLLVEPARGAGTVCEVLTVGDQQMTSPRERRAARRAARNG